MQRSLLKMTVALAALSAPAAALAGTCYLDDAGSVTALVSPIQAGGTGNDFGASPTLCGHEVHGTSCVLEVNVDSTGSASTDCLTLGSGVTVTMNDHTITCSSATQCGTAIKITSTGSGTSKTVLNSGNIAGCWTQGVHAAGVFAEVHDFQIDLAATGSCAGNGDFGTGEPGHDAAFKVIEDTAVRNCDDTCLHATSITTVTDSIAHDCGTGITTSSNGSNASTVDHVLVYDSDLNIQRTDLNVTKVILKDIAIHSASTCELANFAGGCTSGSSEFTFLGANFIGDTINLSAPAERGGRRPPARPLSSTQLPEPFALPSKPAVLTRKRAGARAGDPQTAYARSPHGGTPLALSP